MTKKNELEVSFENPTELAAKAGAVGSTEDMFNYEPDAGDIQLPYIRLAQGLTPEVSAGQVKPGQWIMPDGAVVDSFEATVKGMRKVRRYRAGDDISCRSDDAVIGIGDPGGPCEACPLAQWSGTTEKRIPPLCTLSYQYLVEYETTEAIGMGVVSMSTRSASKVASQLAMYLKMYGMGKTRVTLASALVTKGVRKFNVPTLLKAGPTASQLGGVVETQGQIAAESLAAPVEPLQAPYAQAPLLPE